ncbi:MAG: protein kinase, partial [Pirellulaceae bacterium]
GSLMEAAVTHAGVRDATWTDRGPGGGGAERAAMPRRFGDNELLDEIGRGGMGVVYRALQRSAHRCVALKVIGRERWDGLTESRWREVQDRFRNEALAAARLQHENLVTVYEVGEVDGQPFFSMQLVEGPTISELLTRGPLDSRVAAEYVEAIAGAVHEAHRHGILHRDLKPQNILLEIKSNRPLVVDFGLAKVVEQADAMTKTGDVVGTPSHMSPEQARDSSNVTVQTDVYALGATLYHMLTARPPFQAATPVETLRQVLQQDPVPPRRLNPAIEPDLETICLKCLQKETVRRYTSASELADDLRRFRLGQPIHARPASWLYLTQRWVRRNPLPAAFGAMAATCLLVAFAATLLAYRQQQRTLAVEQDARVRTDESFHDALETVRRLGTRVTNDGLLNQPGMQPLRRELLQEVLAYYEKFLDRRRGDARVRKELATAEFQIGCITEELQSPQAALPWYERARELQQALANERPDDPDLLAALAVTLNRIGRVEHQRQDLAAAVDAYDRALALRRRLAARFPGDLEYQRAVASTTMNLALVESDRGQVEAALAHFPASQDLQQSLVQSHPESTDVWRDLATNAFNQGNWALRQGETARARRQFLAAETWFDKLSRHDPVIPDDEFRLAICLRLLGDVQQEDEASTGAHLSYSRAIQILDRLARANPGVIPYRAQLAASYLNLGQLQQARGEFAVARPSLAQAIGLLEPIVAAQPDLTTCRRDLAVAQYAAGMLSIEARDVTSAREQLSASLEQWEQLVRQAIDPAEAEAGRQDAREALEALRDP